MADTECKIIVKKSNLCMYSEIVELRLQSLWSMYRVILPQSTRTIEIKGKLFFIQYGNLIHVSFQLHVDFL